MEGHCHCQSVRWTYSLPLESVTACNCTICSRYGAIWAYGYLDEGVTITGVTSEYIRGSKVIAFNFCSQCGCVTHYLSISPDEQGRRRVAINLRTVSDPNLVAHIPSTTLLNNYKKSSTCLHYWGT
jgi:hypothetical protein